MCIDIILNRYNRRNKDSARKRLQEIFIFSKAIELLRNSDVGWRFGLISATRMMIILLIAVPAKNVLITFVEENFAFYNNKSNEVDNKLLNIP